MYSLWELRSFLVSSNTNFKRIYLHGVRAEVTHRLDVPDGWKFTLIQRQTHLALSSRNAKQNARKTFPAPSESDQSVSSRELKQRLCRRRWICCFPKVTYSCLISSTVWLGLSAMSWWLSFMSICTTGRLKVTTLPELVAPESHSRTGSSNNDVTMGTSHALCIYDSSVACIPMVRSYRARKHAFERPLLIESLCKRASVPF